MTEKFAQYVEHNGEKYVRIEKEHLDFTAMTRLYQVQNILVIKIHKDNLDLSAIQKKFPAKFNCGKPVQKGDILAITLNNEHNIKHFSEKIENIELLSEKLFVEKYYNPNSTNKKNNKNSLSSDEQYIIYKTFEEFLSNGNKANNSDGDESEGDFTDYNFISSSTKVTFCPKEILAGRIPYNFVMTNSYGQDQFVAGGGYIIKGVDKEAELLYAIEAGKDKSMGDIEKNYSVDADLKDGTTLQDTFKMAIKADKSPIAGMQYNSRDMARAYEQAGKKLLDYMEKYAGQV